MTNRHESPLRLPNGVDKARFLDEFWQKKPLLMRKALPADAFSITSDELAGLACEQDVESRLILEHGDPPWRVEHGPFDDDLFAGLPASHWTLLVQDVDKFVPEVARLIDRFDFIPNWRIDDIMISYAVDRGSVGPHVDAYDVFLMQANGARRWRVSFDDYNDDDLLPDLELRVLSRFETHEDWLLMPGDVLYLPPGVAHWGVAEGECLTCSLGFHAPSQQELAGDWFQYLVESASTRRIADPAGLSPDSPAELTNAVREQARRLLSDMPDTSSADFERWYGCFMTEPKPQFELIPPDRPWTSSDLKRHVNGSLGLARDPTVRVAWSTTRADRVALFCQGRCRELPARDRDAVKYLAETRHIDAATLKTLFAQSHTVQTLLLDLCNDGILRAGDGE